MVELYEKHSNLLLEKISHVEKGVEVPVNILEELDKVREDIIFLRTRGHLVQHLEN